MNAASLNLLRDRLVAMAEADPHILGAAFTGSLALGEGDRWSDIDLVLAVQGSPVSVADAWTTRLHAHFGVAHHWDLPTTDHRVIRVILMGDGVEVDLSFVLEDDFGARGPQWKPLFGDQHALEPFPAPTLDTLVGLAWHHVRHTRVCLERDRLWQAEHWVGALRTQVIALACLRLGLPTAYAKGAHHLPRSFTEALGPSLVREPTAPEILRALSALTDVLVEELNRSAPEAAARLRPHLKAWSSP